LYTFYEDRDGWVKYAVAQISEARRYGGNKPVYVFLWPQYHEPPNAYLPTDFWRLELETAKQYADGVVIWGGSLHETWDNSAPWWIETKKFIDTLKESKQ
jgi:hypothetical protein